MSEKFTGIFAFESRKLNMCPFVYELQYIFLTWVDYFLKEKQT